MCLLVPPYNPLLIEVTLIFSCLFEGEIVGKGKCGSIHALGKDLVIKNYNQPHCVFGHHFKYKMYKKLKLHENTALDHRWSSLKYYNLLETTSDGGGAKAEL